MDPMFERLRRALTAVLADIAATCEQAGRDPATVELVAVSKYATAVETLALARALVACGLEPRLGENRVQSLALKSAELAGQDVVVRWDLIGSLQRNKAAQALRIVDRIHSLDRHEILEQVARLAEGLDRQVQGFLQVNISGEGSKQGFAPEDLPAALEQAAALPRIEILGLMGMAPWGTDHDSARAAFAMLRRLRDRHAPGLGHLSMGMSQDFRGAILEGATVLRIGSALYAEAEDR